MANLAKKISLIIFSAVIIIFISGNVFADNTMLHKAADSARNGVGHTENVIQDTSNTVRDMSGNIVLKTEEQTKDFVNGAKDMSENVRDGAYNATRTATDTVSNAFSNGTVWSWIIVAAIVAGIAFLVWYLVKRNHNE